jgi:branched-chain amino acid transport system ATP-binding protein
MFAKPISAPRTNSMPSGPLLSVARLNAGYGSKQILFDVDVEVGRGEIVVVVGPNGAGKTTLLSAVSGLCRITGGTVAFLDTDITGQRADRITARGLAHCPEGRHIFQRLTVEENLVAAHVRRTSRRFDSLRNQVYGLFPILAERRHGLASRLSGGQQQMLAIGRALMAEPDLMMLDEPSLGLAPKMITQIFAIVLDLALSGMSILLVEQNLRLALEVGDRAYVLEAGRLRLTGSAEEVAAHPALAGLYLAIG